MEAKKPIPFDELSEDNDELETCAVCLSNITGENKDDKACTVDCGHIFHIECISRWIKKSKECPLCRKEVKCYYEYKPEKIMKE